MWHNFMDGTLLLKSAGTWDESEHPRHPTGSDKGGEFAPKGEGAATQSKRGAKPKLTPEERAAAREARLQAKEDAEYKQYKEAWAAWEKLEQAGALQRAQISKIPYLFEYDDNDVTSMTEDPTGGFPPGHPLADPHTRMIVVGQAGQSLSYSNIVGLGGALRVAQALRDGMSEPDKATNFSAYARYKDGLSLLDMMKPQLPKGVTFDDINDAMYRETQARLRKAGITGMVAYRGIHSGFVPKRTSGFKDAKIVSYDMRGLVSWTNQKSTANDFSSEVIGAWIPAERIQALPYLFPKTMGNMGFLSAFGGGRNEDEIITRGDWQVTAPVLRLAEPRKR